MFDAESCGGYDGLEHGSVNVNVNQGAESAWYTSRPCSASVHRSSSNPSIRPNASVDQPRQSARDNEAHGTAELEALDLDFGVQGDAWDPVKQMLNSHSYGAPTEPSTEADVGTG